MISPGWYKDMFDAFFDRFEVKEKGEYGATDALLNKTRGLYTRRHGAVVRQPHRLLAPTHHMPEMQK